MAETLTPYPRTGISYPEFIRYFVLISNFVMAVAEILKWRCRGWLRVRKCDCKMLVRETTVFMLRALDTNTLLYLHRSRRVDFNCAHVWLIITELCNWGRTLSHKSDASQRFRWLLPSPPNSELPDQSEPQTSFSPLRTPITSKSSAKHLRAYRCYFSINQIF